MISSKLENLNYVFFLYDPSFRQFFALTRAMWFSFQARAQKLFFYNLLFIFFALFFFSVLSFYQCEWWGSGGVLNRIGLSVHQGEKRGGSVRAGDPFFI